MASLIHIAEVAAILMVAYALGWAIGYFAHRLSAARPAMATVAAERVAAVTAPTDPDALVRAPVIVPVASEPPSVSPQPSADTAITEAAPSVAEPAVTAEAAAQTPPTATTLPPVEIAVIAAPPPLRIDPIPPLPKPEPEPEPEPDPEPEIPFTATPAARPGVAWSGEIRGRIAPSPQPVPEQDAETVSEPPVEVPLTLELTETIAFVAAPEPATAENVEPESTPLVLDPAAAPTVSAMPDPPLIEPSPATTPVPVHDEDAAMRAIEGGWSRVRARALSDAPELSDVGAAVAAAQTAVKQVLAQAGIDAESPRAARPEGLAVPRAGLRDDLKRINGLGSLDESTLNNLGVYHFDQIAGWDEAQVLWMENHVFARGRIGRENWQQQARDLAAAPAG